jgi:hypothetical protein
MKRNSRIKLVLCLAFVVLFATSAFTTAGPQDDKVVFGGSYVLSDGETLTGNLVILGGNVTLEQGSIVNGDAALVGGTLDAGGTIQGNLTIVGGAAHLGEHAVIDQNVFTIGGNLTRATGSQISGNVTNFAGAPFNLTIPGVPVSPTVPVVPLVQSTTSLLWKMIYFMAMVIVSSALAMLIALLWARPTQRVANAIRTNPIGTGGFGCLTRSADPGSHYHHPQPAQPAGPAAAGSLGHVRLGSNQPGSRQPPGQIVQGDLVGTHCRRDRRAALQPGRLRLCHGPLLWMGIGHPGRIICAGWRLDHALRVA